MSDAFYMAVYTLGWPAFATSAVPVVLHRRRTRRRGAYILAATHFSPFDVACLIKETPRILDFVSIVELFRNPLSAWFLGSMGAFPLDRHHADSPTVRIILDRLARGRVVALFPEGAVRTKETSVLNGGRLKPGVARIARIAGVPIIPCVILGTEAYHHPTAWLPLRRTRYAICYGRAITVNDEEEAEPGKFEIRLRGIYQQLHRELIQAIELRSRAK